MAIEAGSRWAGIIVFVLLVLASMVLIGYGIVRANWHLWLPAPAEQEESWIGSLHIYASCALSLAADVWAGARENKVWVTVCVGLPGVLVGWATLDSPYDLKRHLAAVVSFPLALARVAALIWARGRRQGSSRVTK